MKHNSAVMLAGSVVILAAAILIAAGFGENTGHRHELSMMFGIPTGLLGIIFLLTGALTKDSKQ